MTVMADFGQTDFGQTDFGQLFDRLWPVVGLTNFGQTDFGQFWPDLLFQCFGQTFSTHKTQSPKP